MNALLERARIYREYAATARMTHYRLSDLRARAQQWIGGVTIVLSTVVSAGILTHVQSNPGFAFTLAGGFIGVLASILAAFQTFYKFGETGEKHRLAAANYGDALRALDLFLVRYGEERAQDLSAALIDLEKLATRISDLDKAGPGYPGRVYDRVGRERKGCLTLFARARGRISPCPPGKRQEENLDELSAAGQ